MAVFGLIKEPTLTLTAEVIRADGTRENHVYPAKMTARMRAVLYVAVARKALRNIIAGAFASLGGRQN